MKEFTIKVRIENDGVLSIKQESVDMSNIEILGVLELVKHQITDDSELTPVYSTKGTNEAN